MTNAQKKSELDALAIVNKMFAESANQFVYLQFCQWQKDLIEKRKLKGKK